jgi:hypothetical protein
MKQIVYRSERDEERTMAGLVIMWNGQNTFSVFDNGVEQEPFYAYRDKPTLAQAARIAREWVIKNRWKA